jgi:hypothetical protein
VRTACGSVLWRAIAVTEISGLQSTFCKQCVASDAISNEATVSGKACRLAPVAIDELNLSELYVACPASSRVLVSVSRTPNPTRVSC